MCRGPQNHPQTGQFARGPPRTQHKELNKPRAKAHGEESAPGPHSRDTRTTFSRVSCRVSVLWPQPSAYVGRGPPAWQGGPLEFLLEACSLPVCLE